MIIYQIKNNFNEMRYIGQTVQSLKSRWDSHCSKREFLSMYISRAIQKHGKENFTIEIIDRGESLEDLNRKEEFWIGFLKTISPNGYNLQSGGENRLHSDESKKKMSIANRGKPKSEEHKRKIGEAHKGKIISEEQKRKISESLKGKKFSNERIRKLSESLKGENNPFYGKKHSDESIRKRTESRRRNSFLKKQKEEKENGVTWLFPTE